MADRHPRKSLKASSQAVLVLGVGLLLALGLLVLTDTSQAQMGDPVKPPPAPTLPQPATPPITVDPFSQPQPLPAPPQPLPPPPPPPPPLSIVVPPSQGTFILVLDPKMPPRQLLPTAPKEMKPGGLIIDDLAKVPELLIHEPLQARQGSSTVQELAYQMHKMRFLNDKKRDGFLEELLAQRADLKGLPYAMGDDCRTKGDRSAYFNNAVRLVRAALASANRDSVKGEPGGDQFWHQFQTHCQQETAALLKNDAACEPHLISARIAALSQILATESPAARRGFVKYLQGVATVEATQHLAKLAIYSTEDEVRVPAIEALKVRREKDYTAILLEGLRYPLPAVAKRAADALVRLERNDLIPQLVDLLDEADPRSPVVKKIANKEVPVVRDMVRINHHKNCTLCHAPTGKVAQVPVQNPPAPVAGFSFSQRSDAGPAKVSEHPVAFVQEGTKEPDKQELRLGFVHDGNNNALTAPVPLPDQPLVPPSQGYGQGQSPDIFVRIDVTYLRQDFSVLLPVDNHGPWPEMQRFDYLVRTRVLTDKEASEYKEQTAKRPAGFVTPHQRAVLFALRELTGRDAAPTAQAWREVLDLPTRAKS